MRFLVVVVVLLVLMVVASSPAVTAAVTKRPKEPAVVSSISTAAVEHLLHSEELKRNLHVGKLRRRIQKQIIVLRRHLDEISAKLRATERKLIDNIQRLNTAATKQLHTTHTQWAKQQASVLFSWYVPFLCLLLLLGALAVYLHSLYNRAMGVGGANKPW